MRPVTARTVGRFRSRAPRLRRLTVRRQRGVMLLLLAFLTLSLSLVGILGLGSARLGYYRAIDLERRAEATYLAEAGLNLGIARVAALGPLNSLSLPYTILPVTISGPGSYSAILTNNAGDPGGTLDSDGVLVLSATGWSGGGTRHRTLETTLAVTGGGLSVPGTVTLATGTAASIADSAVITGISAGGSLASNAGVAYEQAGQAIVATGESSVLGSPRYSWAAPAFTTGSGASAQAQSLLETLAGSSSAYSINGAQQGAFGSVTSPAIVVVEAGRNALLKETFVGVGVLIVRGTLTITDHAQFTGLVLVEGKDGSLTISNTGTVTGGIFVTASRGDSRTALKMTDNGLVQYSQTALAFGTGLAGGNPTSLKVRAYIARN